MPNYTETQLDALEAAAPDKNVPGFRNRPREAGRKYLLTPESERSYASVKMFKTDGSEVTGPRVQVYIRDYLSAIDKMDEAPSGRRSNGGNGPRNVATGNIFLDAQVALREQMLSEQERISTRVNDATLAVEAFNADEYKAEVAKEFADSIAELTRRLTAWEADENDVASKSANDTLAELTKRRDTLNAESGDVLANLDKNIRMTEGALKMVIGMDEDAAKALKDANEALFEELAPEPENVPES